MNNWLTNLYKENPDLISVSIERLHDGAIKVTIIQNDSISNSDDVYGCHYIDCINAKILDDSMLRIMIVDLLAQGIELVGRRQNNEQSSCVYRN